MCKGPEVEGRECGAGEGCEHPLKQAKGVSASWGEDSVHTLCWASSPLIELF